MFKLKAIFNFVNKYKTNFYIHTVSAKREDEGGVWNCWDNGSIFK